MSAAKRSHQGQRRPSGTNENTASSNHDATVPASKRFKTSHATNSQEATGLGSLLVADSSRPKITAKLTNGVSQKDAARVDESRTVIASGLDGETESGEEFRNGDGAVTNGINGIAYLQGDKRAVQDSDVAMADGADGEEEEMSFGDILRARHPDIIDISAQLTNPEQTRTIATSAQPVAGHSLATVLQQALKTNDKDLLENCFQLRDVIAIKNTIQRLPSPLVAQLLARVSERMYRRPGRAGALMIWIQWSLVAHGGYLASQPEILHKLKALNQVIKQRAQGLQPLLQLKGKLDMLNAQLELRRETQISQRLRTADVNDEAGVVYVEGDPDNDWDVDSDDEPSIAQIQAGASTGLSTSKVSGIDVSDDDIDDFNPEQADDSEEDDQDEAEVGVADASVLDLEAVESDGLEDMSQDAEEEDEEEDDDEDAEQESEQSVSVSASEEDDDDSSDEDDESSHVRNDKLATHGRSRTRHL